MKTAESATRYPLTWPAGWPRLRGHERTRAKFNRKEWRSYNNPQNPSGGYNVSRSMTVSESCSRVLAELSRMGVESGNVIVSTNVQTRLDGLPYSNRGEPLDPGAAVYWRTKKGDKVMAIDRYDRVADNLAAIAATLEAMRSIERHGGASILDRVFTGFTALPSPEQASAPGWREVLKLYDGEGYIPSNKLTLKMAEDAYRRRRSETHPDKNGGDASQFDLVQRAWDQAQQELRA